MNGGSFTRFTEGNVPLTFGRSGMDSLMGLFRSMDVRSALPNLFKCNIDFVRGILDTVVPHAVASRFPRSPPTAVLRLLYATSFHLVSSRSQKG